MEKKSLNYKVFLVILSITLFFLLLTNMNVFNIDKYNFLGRTVLLNKFSASSSSSSSKSPSPSPTPSPCPTGKINSACGCISSNESCCGKYPYNTSTHGCCNGATYNISIEGCCAGKKYNLNNQSCCTGKILNVKDGCCKPLSIYRADGSQLQVGVQYNGSSYTNRCSYYGGYVNYICQSNTGEPPVTSIGSCGAGYECYSYGLCRKICPSIPPKPVPGCISGTQTWKDYTFNNNTCKWEEITTSCDLARCPNKPPQPGSCWPPPDYNDKVNWVWNSASCSWVENIVDICSEDCGAYYPSPECWPHLCSAGSTDICYQALNYPMDMTTCQSSSSIVNCPQGRTCVIQGTGKNAQAVCQ